jgi:hypothetical protein
VSVACCPLNGDHDEGPTVFSEEVRRAAKEHTCSECREPIKVGDRYENATGLWDGHWSTYRTCLSCVEIRNHFACSGWLYEHVWSDIEENMFPDMRAGGQCLDGLSPAAKARLFDLRMTWLFDNSHAVDGAVPPWMAYHRTSCVRYEEPQVQGPCRCDEHAPEVEPPTLEGSRYLRDFHENPEWRERDDAEREREIEWQRREMFPELFTDEDLYA